MRPISNDLFDFSERSSIYAKNLDYLLLREEDIDERDTAD